MEIPLDSSNSSLARWTRKPYHLYGDCFSLDLGPAVTSLSVSQVSFASPGGIYVFFHHPGQYLAIDSMVKVREESPFFGGGVGGVRN